MIAQWTKPRYVCAIPDAMRQYFMINGVRMGSISWYAPEGPFYPVTQVRRFGAVEEMKRAIALIEKNAVLDVVKMNTEGNA